MESDEEQGNNQIASRSRLIFFYNVRHDIIRLKYGTATQFKMGPKHLSGMAGNLKTLQ